MAAVVAVSSFFFFFSSRRRHTRYWRDWSSDVCSSDLMKWVKIGVVVIVLGVAGYFGYPFGRDWLAKRSEAAKASSAAATQQVATAASAEPAAPATPAPEKELPLLPAVWTLDLDTAKIPTGRANGMISGTNFVVETARLDKVGAAYLDRKSTRL